MGCTGDVRRRINGQYGKAMTEGQNVHAQRVDKSGLPNPAVSQSHKTTDLGVANTANSGGGLGYPGGPEMPMRKLPDEVSRLMSFGAAVAAVAPTPLAAAAVGVAVAACSVCESPPVMPRPRIERRAALFLRWARRCRMRMSSALARAR